MKRILPVIMTAAMIISLAACGAAKDAGKVVIATGGTSGTYYAVGGVLQTVLGPLLPKMNITVESTGASVANVNMITDGEAQMAILQSDVLTYAHEGINSFEGKPEKKALWVAGIYNETVQILAKPGISCVSDLKGKTVCVGDVGSGTEINAWQILSAAGIGKNDIKAVNGSFQDGVDQLRDGKIDAAFTVAGAPTTAIVEYAAANELNLVSLSADELSLIQKAYPFLIRDDLPKGTYTGQDEDVVCVAVQATLAAADSLSEDAVYEFTKKMFENKDSLLKAHAKFGSLDAGKAALSGSVPLHKGAEKYYKEIGVIK